MRLPATRQRPPEGRSRPADLRGRRAAAGRRVGLQRLQRGCQDKGELAALASSRAVRELSSRPRPYGAAGERSTKTTACCPQRSARPPWRAVCVSASASEENQRLG